MFRSAKEVKGSTKTSELYKLQPPCTPPRCKEFSCISAARSDRAKEHIYLLIGVSSIQAVITGGGHSIEPLIGI